MTPPFQGGPIDATATSGSASGSWSQPAAEGVEALAEAVKYVLLEVADAHENGWNNLRTTTEAVVAAVLAAGYVSPNWLAALLSDAEQRGLEAGRGDLAHWEAVWKAEALREAVDELGNLWVKKGKHFGQPGCYSSGYEHWLRDRAASIARSVEGGEES